MDFGDNFSFSFRFVWTFLIGDTFFSKFHSRWRKLASHQFSITFEIVPLNVSNDCFVNVFFSLPSLWVRHHMKCVFYSPPSQFIYFEIKWQLNWLSLMKWNMMPWTGNNRRWMKKLNNNRLLGFHVWQSRNFLNWLFMGVSVCVCVCNPKMEDKACLTTSFSSIYFDFFRLLNFFEWFFN